MLTSLVITLTSPAEARLPALLGRAAQAALLAEIGRRDPALAGQLHAEPSAAAPVTLRPYTAGNLVLGRRKQGTLHISAGQSGWLRFTGLTAEVSRVLQAMAAEPPPTLTLDHHVFTVTGATLNPAEHPWAASTHYQELAAPFLLGGLERPAGRIRLSFVSPTTFKSQGRWTPLPLPELVFGSLLDRWQTFAPIALHPEARRFAAEAVAPGRYKLRSRGIPQKGGGVRVGFTGWAEFVALNRDRYWLNILHLLAAYSFFSGVGYGAAAGLGQCRVTEDRG
ncbi:MAG: CRISPR-associated endoribonuclease Cas6 [Anaerolineae bacterium]